MQSFFFVCPVRPEFSGLCTAHQAVRDHFILHDCIACGMKHVVDNRTGRVVRPASLSAVAAPRDGQAQAEPVQLLIPNENV